MTNKNPLQQVTALLQLRKYPLIAAIIALISFLFFDYDWVKDIVTPESTSSYKPIQVDVSKLPKTPYSFTQAKTIVYNTIYKGHEKTFYCGCNFDKKRAVDLRSCNVKPRLNKDRASRIEAEHIIPASWFGMDRQCWNEPLCKDKKGEAYKGRECCLNIDPFFRVAHNDLYNLTPAVGEVNGDRSNLAYGIVAGEKREYGACDFEIDRDTKLAEPMPSIRGDIARVGFYMEKTYQVTFPPKEKELFIQWDKEDPVDEWERNRNQRIAEIQGRSNPFVK